MCMYMYKYNFMCNLRGAARVSPRAPSGRIRFADDIRQIFDAGDRSSDDIFQKFEHSLYLSLDLYFLSLENSDREIYCGREGDEKGIRFELYFNGNGFEL